jgi:hypothetical protein
MRADKAGGPGPLAAWLSDYIFQDIDCHFIAIEGFPVHPNKMEPTSVVAGNIIVGLGNGT